MFSLRGLGPIVAAGVVILVASPAHPVATAPVAAEELPRVITVNGDDEVKASPDKATVHLGVQSQGPTANDAMRRNNELMGAVITAIRSASIPDQDIQTVGLSLWPIHSQTEPFRITGYQAHNSVSVTVNDLGRLVWVIDGGIGAGANMAGGVYFGFKDDAAMRRSALVGAARTARAKAQALADAMGVTILGLHSMSEGGFGGPIPLPIGAPAVPALPERGGAPTPVQPGQLTVSASVTASFIIG